MYMHTHTQSCVHTSNITSQIYSTHLLMDSDKPTKINIFILYYHFAFSPPPRPSLPLLPDTVTALSVEFGKDSPAI